MRPDQKSAIFLIYFLIANLTNLTNRPLVSLYHFYGLFKLYLPNFRHFFGDGEGGDVDGGGGWRKMAFFLKCKQNKPKLYLTFLAGF